MRYQVVGATASILLGIFSAVHWALHATLALAWTAFAFGVLGLLVLIACLWRYARPEARDAPQEHPWTAVGPAQWLNDRAQERTGVRQPRPVTAVRPAGPGASTPRPHRREAHPSRRTVAPL